MSEELILRLKAPVSMSMFATKTDLYMDVLQQRKEAAARIEQLEQKLRTTSLEALAISDTNNDLVEEAQRLRGLVSDSEKERYRVCAELLKRTDASEARLSEAVKVLKVISDTSHRTRDREHYKFPLVIMEWVDAFIATLGGEKNE